MQCNVSTGRIYIISIYIQSLILRKNKEQNLFQQHLGQAFTPIFWRTEDITLMTCTDLRLSADLCTLHYRVVALLLLLTLLGAARLKLIQVSSKLQKQTACCVNLWILEFLRPRPVFKWTQAIMDVFDSENPSEQQKKNLLTKPHSSSNGISMLELGGLCRVQSMGHGLQQTIWEKLENSWDLLICWFASCLQYCFSCQRSNITIPMEAAQLASLFQIIGTEALHIQWSETFHC